MKILAKFYGAPNHIGKDVFLEAEVVLNPSNNIRSEILKAFTVKAMSKGFIVKYLDHKKYFPNEKSPYGFKFYEDEGDLWEYIK